MRRRETGSGPTRSVVAVLQHDAGGLRYDQDVVTPVYYPKRTICWDEIHPDHPKSGGPFSLTSVSSSFNYGYGEWGIEGPDRYNKPYTHIYRGGFHVYGSEVQPARLDSEALSLGAAAYKKFSPLKPAVSGGQFLYELKSMGIQDLMSTVRKFWLSSKNIPFVAGTIAVGARKGMKTQSYKNASDAYLAYQFGWKPFLRDLRDWLKSIQTLDENIATLRNQNGKWVRKGGVLFKTKTNSQSSTIMGTFGPPVDALYQLPGTTQSTTTEIERKCWFQGTFRYCIPGLDDPKWGKFKAARILWGLDMTPQLVWQVMPWSWLANWFIDVDSLLTSFNDQIANHLVSRGAWLMLRETATSTSSYTRNVRVVDQITGATRRAYRIDASVKVTKESKTRVAASPFGFGISLPDLDSWRLSILTALGMSKLRIPTARL